MDKRLEEEDRVTAGTVPEDAANSEAASPEAARKAAFEKAMNKVFTDHDELFRKLAQ